MKTKTLRSMVLAVILLAFVAISGSPVPQWSSSFTGHSYKPASAVLIADGPEEVPPSAVLVADGPEEVPPAALLVADGPEEVPPVFSQIA
jgi:hypothetical protein